MWGRMRRAGRGAVAWMRRYWMPLVLGVALAVVGLLAVPQLLPHVDALRQAPEYPASRAAPLATAIATQITNEKDRLTLEKDLLAYETDSQVKIWTTMVQVFMAIVQAVGGAVLLLGVVFTWRNLRATQAKLDIDREGQITNRFTQAVAQLGAELKDGKPHLEVRLGGIYALERIARDSSKDHWTIMEVLTAYVRQNAPWPPAPVDQADRQETPAEHGLEGQIVRPPTHKLRTDIQAVLTVLGRRGFPKRSPEPGLLDLSETDLRGANLKGHLDSVYLRDAHLEGANLSTAHLEGAYLRGVHLEEANLMAAHLEGANLSTAHLEGADLTSVHLDGAILAGTHLEGADLRSVQGLTREQIQDAYEAGKGALLPAYLLAPTGPSPSEPAP